MSLSKDEGTRSPHLPESQSAQPAAMSSTWRRRRAAFVLALGLAVLAGGAALYFRSGPDRLTDRPAERSTTERIKMLARKAETLEPSLHPQELEACLVELTEARPDDPEWWKRLASLHVGSQRSTDAVATYRRALDAPLPAEDSDRLRLGLAAQLIEIGDLPAARVEIERLRELGMNHPQFSVCVTRLLRLEGKSAEALEYLTRSVPPERRDASVFLMLGLLEFDLEHFAAARDRLAESARLNPFGELAQFKLAECARLLGDAEKEREHRARYQSLHTARSEISLLTMRLRRDGSLDADQKRRLAESYAAVGNDAQSEFWSKQTQTEVPAGDQPAGRSGASPPDRSHRDD